MLRGLLTAYLLFASLAGPCGYCCLASQLLARAAAAGQTASTHPTASACRHCTLANDTAGACSGCCPTSRPSDDPVNGPRPGPACPVCPCGGPSLCYGSLTAKLDDTGSTALLRWLLGAAQGGMGFDVANQPVPQTVAADNATSAALPFLSAQDLLHLHHRLRC
jgi:hypothetical protein